MDIYTDSKQKGRQIYRRKTDRKEIRFEKRNYTVEIFKITKADFKQFIYAKIFVTL